MSIGITTIKSLTRKLASMKLKKYNSLSEVKEDFDSVAAEFIELNYEDKEVLEQLKIASKYFNQLTEEDFTTNDQQMINEYMAIKSRFTKELNIVIVKWRKEHGQL